MLRIGWFSTGRGSGSRNLLKAVMDERSKGKLDVEIAFVFCNWDNTEDDNPRKDQRDMFFNMVHDYGIPLIKSSWKRFRPELRKNNEDKWRAEYGRVLREKTGVYDFDLGILAGYMLWVDDETCNTYDLLNLHPALPDGPKGTWEDVIWELMENNKNEQGAMMHLCTEEWDRGAPVSYCHFSIRGHGYDELWHKYTKKLKGRTADQIREDEGVEEPLFKKIRENGAKRELPMIVSTIKAFADGIIHIEEKMLYAGPKKLEKPYDLTKEVDASLR